MRKRKVITRSGARVRGYFWSYKSRKSIPWESPLERKALLVMDSDPRIASIADYQLENEIEDGRENFIAYPDFLVHYVDGTSEIVEVKCDAALEDKEVRRRLNLVEPHFRRLGVPYRVMAEAEICRQPRLKNLETLATYRRPGLATVLAGDASVRALLNLNSSTTLGYVASRLGNMARAHQLIAIGLLRADLETPLELWTRITVGAEVRHDALPN
jgi:hypothetical protein